jgi:hypothetical protein
MTAGTVHVTNLAPGSGVQLCFMSHEECDHVVNTAEPLMEKSGVIDAKTGEGLALTPGCQIGYMDPTGCHQLVF